MLCCLPLLEFSFTGKIFIVKPYYCNNIFLDKKKGRYIDDLDTDMDKGIDGRDRDRCRDRDCDVEIWVIVFIMLY